MFGDKAYTTTRHMVTSGTSVLSCPNHAFSFFICNYRSTLSPARHLLCFWHYEKSHHLYIYLPSIIYDGGLYLPRMDSQSVIWTNGKPQHHFVELLDGGHKNDAVCNATEVFLLSVSKLDKQYLTLIASTCLDFNQENMYIAFAVSTCWYIPRWGWKTQQWPKDLHTQW